MLTRSMTDLLSTVSRPIKRQSEVLASALEAGFRSHLKNIIPDPVGSDVKVSSVWPNHLLVHHFAFDISGT